jgi:N-acetylmuramoyl-L-alanine amidase/type II secretory pathway predicted ATPase ExeA
VFLDFYNLRQQPFGVTPDPTYLYASRTHREALAALSEGVKDGRGFLALIAEPGMGKTTLLYQLLENLRETARTAYLFQTQCDGREFFQYLLGELGIDTQGMGLVAMHNKLNEILFAEMLAGKRFVLVVDEAQNLDDSVLETIRLLSNFETWNTKLLQIVLAGQPELADKLAQPRLSQLLQRITVLNHLEPLSPFETGGYIDHRLKVAGYCGEPLFAAEALALVAHESGGVPRRINKLCFNALSEGHAQGQQQITREIVAKIAGKTDVPTISRSKPEEEPTPASEAETAPEPAAQLTYQPLAQSIGSRWLFWMALASVILFGLGGGLVYQSGRFTNLAEPVLSFFSFQHETIAPSSDVLADSAPATRSPTGRHFYLRAYPVSRYQSAASFSISAMPPADSNRTSTDATTQGALQEMSEPEGLEAEKGNVVQPRESVRGVSRVTGIETSIAANQTRVVVALDDTVQYESGRISPPDRIYFDLHKARLSPSLGLKTIHVDNGLVQTVRTAQNQDDVVRLVLDVAGPTSYSARLFSNPYRLVIEAYPRAIEVGKQASSDASASTVSVSADDKKRGDGAAQPVHPSAANNSPSPSAAKLATGALATPQPTTDTTKTTAGLISPPGGVTTGNRSLTRELGLKISRIVIDPGHGGRDTGTIGPHGVLEKDVCLDVALRLGNLIEENLPNAEVIYTRSTDRYVSLEERTAIANQAKADLFISIHANSSDDHAVRGVETYYLNLATSPESAQVATRENALSQMQLHDLQDLIKKIAGNDKIKESREFAIDIQNSLSRRLQRVNWRETNRGVKRAPFIVLIGAEMPSVLSEISFVSNTSDERLLANSDHRERMAEGLFNGIATYLAGLNSLSYNARRLMSDNHAGTLPKPGAAQ